MGRKKKTATLDELIPLYGEHKEMLDNLSKVCKDENEDIKILLGNKTEHIADGWRVYTTSRSNEKMDEDLLCTKLANFSKAYDLGIIKVREYVDTDALESAIYKGELTKEMIEAVNKCRIVKPPTVSLYVKRVKEEDKNES